MRMFLLFLKVLVMIGESKMFVVDTAEGQSYLVNTEDESVDPSNINIRQNDNGGELALFNCQLLYVLSCLELEVFDEREKGDYNDINNYTSKVLRVIIYAR